MDFSKIKAVIFDFDGVIANTAEDISRSVNATLEHFGYKPLSNKQIIIFVGNGAEKLLKRSIAASLQISKETPPQEPSFEDVYNWYIEYYKQHCIEETTLYPGVLGLLELLAIEEIPVAIVSNKPHEITDAILNKLDIGRYFASIIGPEQTSHVKPDPEGLILAMEHINEKQKSAGLPAIFPENVLMVGDAATDIQAGKNAGTKTCAIMTGYGNKEKLAASGADVSLLVVSELIVYMQQVQSIF